MHKPQSLHKLLSTVGEYLDPSLMSMHIASFGHMHEHVPHPTQISVPDKSATLEHSFRSRTDIQSN